MPLTDAADGAGTDEPTDPSRRRGAGGNLPAQPSRFVGRRREIAHVKRLLAGSRLVTLTGVGGVGKTRLALQVAGTVTRAFDDGVWFVDLTQGFGPDEGLDVLAYRVLAALGVRQQGEEAPAQQVIDHLAAWHALLVVDNCEHVLPACATLVAGLLRACARLQVLITSREPLGIDGEELYPVPPLPVPDPNRRTDLGRLARFDSVALFLIRAQALVPDFALTDQNHDAVTELCRRLDGLPLPIELAAARAGTLAPQQILDRLADRFTLLSRGSRSAVTRQQTLRASVDWSFELCTKPERRLWSRLSVFAGTFSLDAVEGVCADEELPTDDLLDVLSGLVDKSIVSRADIGSGHGGEARYRLLETIREYGLEQLTDPRELAVLHRRHCDWYEQLVARANAEWVSDRQVFWYARLIAEDVNLRASVEYCLSEPGRAETAVQIVTSLPRLYWWERGSTGEGLVWLDRALARITAPTMLRARALLQSAYLAPWHRDADAVLRLLEEGQQLAERLHDARALAFAAYTRAQAALMRNYLTSTIESVEQGLAILTTMPEPDLALRLHLLLTLGSTAQLIGDYDRAKCCFHEVWEIAESHGESFCRSTARYSLGLLAWLEDRTPEADHHLRESLRAGRAAALHNRWCIALAMECLAWTASSQQRYERAATLLAASAAQLTDIDKHLPTMLTDYHDACARQTRDSLGNAAFTAAFRHGQALPLHDALAYALGDPAESTPSLTSRTASAELTPREYETAQLIARGLANKEIAKALVISQRTAESHVEHILAKLGFANRAQIAAWVTTNHPGDRS